MSEELLFTGLKVLDVASWIAAPSCAAMLADRGADVIKIEQPEVGDAYRTYYGLPISPNSDINYTWTLDNRSKRSLTLNLKTAAGIDILHRLIKDCDVYITNQPLPLRRELNLMSEDILPMNERLIYASITAYGEEGPEKDREGFDLVGYWSRSGLMNKMRHKGSEPVQAMAGMGDHPTGVALYAGIVTALLQRERTGKGGKVHTSLLANGLWSAACLAQSAWAGADASQVPGPRLTTALYEAADGRWMQFSMIRKEEEFDQLVLALDHLEWLADERFSSPERRVENQEALTQIMREVIAERSSQAWMQLFREQGIPAALVAEFEDLPTDPQVIANDMAVIPAEDLGMERLIRDPVNVEGLGRKPATQAPNMGEHTDQILDQLGYSTAEIAGLRSEGIV
jgi:crotonobetainyl-CoA:carnitine CoA-transferase CaiB-like acyl-CoA transferase